MCTVLADTEHPTALIKDQNDLLENLKTGYFEQVFVCESMELEGGVGWGDRIGPHSAHCCQIKFSSQNNKMYPETMNS